MRFRLTWTSGDSEDQEVEIDSLSELIDLAEKEKCSVILHCPDNEGSDYLLEIYDDYRE